MKYLKQKAAFILAHQMCKIQQMPFCDSLRIAWRVILTGAYNMVSFVKNNGEETTRIISKDWTKFQAPKNSGQKMPNSLIIMVDLAKYLSNEPTFLISAHKEKIILDIAIAA